MKPKWLIEDFGADNKFDLLAEETKKRGFDTVFVRYIPFEIGSYNKFEPNDCVVVQSSLNLARQLMREKRWIPGPWLNSNAFECSTYYAYLGKHHINNKYTLLPRAEVPRFLPTLRRQFSENGDLFIRPSSGQKTFTGKVFLEKHWDKNWEWVEEYTEPESLIIISSPKVIDREWRFIVADGEIITGSLYKERIGSLFTSKYREVDDANDIKDALALVKAKEVAAEGYHPDPMFVIDICESNNKMYLLEIGSFSCAGLYDCNITKVVDAASQIAVREWEDVHNI